MHYSAYTVVGKADLKGRVRLQPTHVPGTIIVDTAGKRYQVQMDLSLRRMDVPKPFKRLGRRWRSRVDWSDRTESGRRIA